MKLIPYLAFNGQCEEALTFYRDCLNGNIERTMYYSNDQDIGMEIPEHMVGQVMNMALTIGDDAIMGPTFRTGLQGRQHNLKHGIQPGG